MGDEATGTADGSAEAPEGIDRAGVEAWFGEHVPGVQLPLSFERISGGHSNLTYGVRDAAGGRWALRRPPLGKRLGSAHDMGREHRVVSALAPTPVPVAPVVGLCEDESVNGAPFYVMEFVEGPILRGLAEAEAFPDEADRRAIGERVVDTLVDDPRRRPRRGRASASSAARRTTSPASCTAGRASGRSRRRASWRRSTPSTSASPRASPSRARRRSSTATTASTT